MDTKAVVTIAPKVLPVPAGRTISHRRLRIRHATAMVAASLTAGACALSIWYLVKADPSPRWGVVDATHLEIQAQVAGRVAEINVIPGQSVRAGAALAQIENPGTLAKLKQAIAAKALADAELAKVNAGTRREVIASRKAAYEKAQAAQTMAQKTYERTRQLRLERVSAEAELDVAAGKLEESQKGLDQARSDYEEALNGATPEERRVAVATVEKAIADVDAIQATLSQMVVTAPIAARVYKSDAEPGEFVSAGTPLLTLIEPWSTWFRFDLPDSSIKSLRVGELIRVWVPALRNRAISAVVRVITVESESVDWSTTRHIGDQIFEVRAYPIKEVLALQPGMRVYTDWRRQPQEAASAIVP